MMMKISEIQSYIVLANEELGFNVPINWCMFIHCMVFINLRDVQLSSIWQSVRFLCVVNTNEMCSMKKTLTGPEMCGSLCKYLKMWFC